MGDTPSKEQNEKQQGKVVVVLQKENTRVEYTDGVRSKEQKTVDMCVLSSDDSSSFRTVSTNRNQKALEYK